jgi:1,4-alpha-glucan branching enzyme
VKDLNQIYQAQPAQFKHDFDHHGFEWIDCHDAEQSVISYRRKDDNQDLIIVLNFTPVVRDNYRIGAPKAGPYEEIVSGLNFMVNPNLRLSGQCFLSHHFG